MSKLNEFKMGRKAVYRKDITSIQVSQLVSVILGMQRRFSETKGDVIERIILQTVNPELVESIRKELDKKLENVKQKKLDVQQQERRLKQDNLLHSGSNSVSDNNEVYDPNKTYSNIEICQYICERLNLPKTGILLLSAEVKHLKNFIERGEIIQVNKNSYRIAPITDN